MKAKHMVSIDLNEMIKEIVEEVGLDNINVARECKRVGISRTSFYKYWNLKDNGDYGDMRLDELNRFLNIFGYRLDMLISKVDNAKEDNA